MMQAGSTQFGRHGGRLGDARAAYPHAPTPWIDLSTGINPHPWQPSAPGPIDDGPLPDVGALARLESAAASFFGAAPDRIVAVPGSEIALRLLPTLGLPEPVIALTPTYGTHEAIAQERIDCARLDETAGTRCTLLIANPNNPDGRLLGRDVLVRLATKQREAGGWLAIDEAFMDVMPASGAGPGLPADAPVLTFRSFGKFFGLAGIRLGFVVGPAPIVGRYRALLGDWPVSSQAIAHGSAAYADRDWIDAARLTLASRAAELDRLLARHGLRSSGACPLFRLVEDVRAPELFDRLAAAGILSRPFGYRADWLRLGLPGDRHAMARLDRALAGG